MLTNIPAQAHAYKQDGGRGITRKAHCVDNRKTCLLDFSRIKQRGISIDALTHLLPHGQVEKQFDSAQVMYLDSPTPSPTWGSGPKPRLYAVVDVAGEV